MTIFAIQPGLQTLPFVSVCGEAKPPASKQLVNPPAIPRPATIPMISQTFMIALFSTIRRTCDAIMPAMSRLAVVHGGYREPLLWNLIGFEHLPAVENSRLGAKLQTGRGQRPPLQRDREACSLQNNPFLPRNPP